MVLLDYIKRIIILESMKVDSKQVKETIHIANERLENTLCSKKIEIFVGIVKAKNSVIKRNYLERRKEIDFIE